MGRWRGFVVPGSDERKGCLPGPRPENLLIAGPLALGTVLFVAEQR